MALAVGGCESREEKAQMECENMETAYFMSQVFVKRRLKTPATAEFPLFRDREVIVKYLGDCTHEVYAYVDAQNSFGAKIRNKYIVKLRNTKGTDRWDADDVQIF